jgi:drug/metabolite transporter (DMT)-like permease
LVIAFAAIYLIWGSTYLAIRVAVETMPPFTLAGIRFIVAGALLYAWLAWQGRVRSTPRQWGDNAVIGALLLVGGNAMVTWAEVKIPSGITTLLISISPLLMVMFEWISPRGLRPTWATFAGLGLGFGGLVLLVGGDTGGGALDPWGCAAILFSCVCWSFGSIYSRHVRNPADPMVAATQQMLLGGVMMVIIGQCLGETNGFRLQNISTHSALAWAYLVVAGSLIAFPAYLYLLKHSTPARVSTYAYVNPMVAVFLGWLVLSEPVNRRTLVASVIIITAVAIITTQKARATVKKP